MNGVVAVSWISSWYFIILRPEKLNNLNVTLLLELNDWQGIYRVFVCLLIVICWTGALGLSRVLEVGTCSIKSKTCSFMFGIKF